MRLAHLLFDTHLGNGHTGLDSILKKKRLKLKEGDCAIFINTAFTAVKIFVDGVFVAHYKHPTGRIAPETIRHLPNYLNGSQIEYKRALEQVINKQLSKR